jgi:hypothetical protein
MTTKKKLWPKIGRILTGLVTLGFFLPFFGVSCESDGQSMDVITISGTDMVGGCRPGGLLSEAESESKSGKGSITGGDIKIENVDREPLAILALAFALTAFALAWVRKRTALLATFVIALAGLGAMGGLFVKVRGQLVDAIDKESTGLGKSSKRDKDMSVSAGSRFGFWAVSLGLIGVAVLTGRELRDKDPLPEARALPPSPPA